MAMLCLVRRNGLVLYETLADIDELVVSLELGELTFRFEIFRLLRATQPCEDRKIRHRNFNRARFV